LWHLPPHRNVPEEEAIVRTVIIPLVALVLLGALGAPAWIAWRSGRAMHAMLLESAPPSPLLAQTAQIGVPGLKDASITAPDGVQLAAWYVPPTQGASIILAHGTGSDRSALLQELRLLAAAGFGVLAFDWPGLGQSTGSIRWDAQARGALTAAIDWLAVQPGVDPQRIGGLGFSIGGYLMTQVAAQDTRLRAVVLESPSPDFNQYVQLHSRRWGTVSEWGGRRALRGSGLLEPALQPLQLIRRIAPRPVLLIGGTRDANVPIGMVEQLYEAAGNPRQKWLIEGASHGDYAAVAPAEYERRLREFFAEALQK
jgi:uncharacterized protein